MSRMKACSGNSAWRVCQTSPPQACPDGIWMPGLVNYSERRGSPVKPNVCLQAVSFSCLVRRPCSFHLQPLASRFWTRMQELHEVDVSTRGCSGQRDGILYGCTCDEIIPFFCRGGRGGQQTEGDWGSRCETHVTASTPHWAPCPSWPLPRYGMKITHSKRLHPSRRLHQSTLV